MKKSIVSVIIIAVIVVIGSLALYNIMIKPSPTTNDDQTQLKKFSSVDELKSYLKESADMGGSFYGYSGSFSVNTRTIDSSESISGPTAMKSTEYSTTNIQVDGVDEADTIKNDDKYIYTISGNNITIIDAHPADSAKIVSKTEVNGTPSQIFVNKDRLIVFVKENYAYPYYGEAVGITKSSFVPNYNSQKTMVNIYDIKDRSNPMLEKEYSLDGYYYNSRMIKNYVYTITNQAVYDFENPSIPDSVYRCTGGENEMMPKASKPSCFNLWYFDRPDSSHQFTIITSINIETGEQESKVFVLGNSQTLYVSKDNIYVTYTRSLTILDFLDKMIDGINPLLPKNIGNRVNEIKESSLFSNSEKMSAMVRVVDNYTKTLSPEQRLEFQKKMENKTLELQEELAKEMEKTIIHKISINNGKIEYITQGEAPGNVLNQFSMDEYNGYLRIATTTDNWRTASKNHVYVLDKTLKIVGKLEDLAKGERIYSVRFLGDKGYMVTFRQIDPLFVIDLAPTNPKVLGFLKIPGVSDYIHPYDETHIIGLGRDATEQGRIKGLKLALFDVSNVENPKEISSFIIGESGTYSEAIYDHKAFLFSKAKNLLVIPASVTENNTYNAFQGAYVFNINIEDGIHLKGRITHENKTTENKYYYEYLSQVSRSLYIGNVLYTVSKKMIKANDLEDLKELNNIIIQKQENIYPPPILENMPIVTVE